MLWTQGRLLTPHLGGASLTCTATSSRDFFVFFFFAVYTPGCSRVSLQTFQTEGDLESFSQLSFVHLVVSCGNPYEIYH